MIGATGMQWLAEAVEPGGGINAIVPEWITDLGWVGIAILAVWAFATNKLYTAGQVEKLLAAERKVTDVWQESDRKTKEALERLIEELHPIADGNAAVLKAIEAVQASQAEDRARRLRGDRR